MYSTGRCGSTLLQKALGVHGVVQSFSEPDVFWCLGDILGAFVPQGETEEEIEERRVGKECRL